MLLKYRLFEITASIGLLLIITGCEPKQDLAKRIEEIQTKHNVEITIESNSNRKELAKLLDTIDEDLSGCSEFFKSNIGPIMIEDSFIGIGAKGLFVAAYVDGGDSWEDFPIHIKNRSGLDKILFPVPREKDVFLHEASHSFELNLKDEVSDKWTNFEEQFNNAQVTGYNASAPLGRLMFTYVPRPKSMPSYYGSTNHYEDFAETHCYLKRNDIEKIKDSDPILYFKCRLVEHFVSSGSIPPELYATTPENEK
ncbi:MAG: hypothetical protein JW837_09315 [Sedimentisphaerales bacterium]|nr:hypothetical protein [Sedimentisphaerales bacterium]